MLQKKLIKIAPCLGPEANRLLLTNDRTALLCDRW